VKVTWTSNVRAFADALERATAEGLEEAAQMLARVIREKVAAGYTSGKFATGASAATIQVIVKPGETPGEFKVTIGTDSEVVAAWELGHHNLFTRQYERVEHWRRSAEDVAARAADIVRERLTKVKVA
jgi:hypothetical protein